MKRFALIAFFAAACIGLAFAPALAQVPASTSHGGIHWGDYTIGPDQVVEGNVTDLFGTVTVAGTVYGDVTTIFGSVQQEPGSTITGNKNEIFGNDYQQTIVPWLPAATSREHSHLFMRLVENIVIVLAFLIFPLRARMALGRLEEHPGLCALVGVLAFVAIVPVAILLFVSFIGWPLIPVEIVAVLAGLFIGQAALGLMIGRRLYELIHQHTTPSPLAALIIGLVILTAAEIVPVLGYLVTALVWFVGLGAAVLAFLPTSTIPPRMRTPIGGPPMGIA